MPLKPGGYPPLARLCVDAAHAVWAVPANYPEAEARLVGSVHKTRGQWAWEHTLTGLSAELYPDPLDAADGLLAFLDGRNQQKEQAA